MCYVCFISDVIMVVVASYYEFWFSLSWRKFVAISTSRVRWANQDRDTF